MFWTDDCHIINWKLNGNDVSNGAMGILPINNVLNKRQRALTDQRDLFVDAFGQHDFGGLKTNQNDIFKVLSCVNQAV